MVRLPPSKILRRLLRSCAIGLAAFALLGILGLTLVLGTGPGQRGLLGLVARLASTPEALVSIDGFEGSLFSNGRITRITVSDTQGRWLEIEKLAYSWRPFQMLFGYLDIANLSAAKVSILRNPETPATSKVRTSKSDWELQLPFGIRLGRAEFGEILLGKDVIGAPARLAAAANLSLVGLRSDIIGAVDVRRIDGREGWLKAAIKYDAATGAIEADLSAFEPAGGLVATLLESPGLPPLRATLIGRGKPADMQLGMTLESADKAFTIGKGRLWRESDRQLFAASLDGYLTTVLPQDFRDLFAGRTQVELAGRLADDGAALIEAASLNSDALRIKGHGLIDAAHAMAHGEITMSIAADGRPVRLPHFDTQAISVAGADVRLVISDKAAQRPLTLSTVMRGIKSEELGTIERLELAASAVQPAPGGRNWRKLDSITVRVTGAGIAAVDPRFKGFAGPDLALNARGHASSRSLVVDMFEGHAGTTKVSGKGAFKKDKFEGRIEIGVADLAVLSGLADRPMGGSANLVGQGHWPLQGGRGKVHLDLALINPRAGIPQLDSLLAGQHAVRATVLRDRHGGLKFDDISLSGDGIEGKANVQLAGLRPSGRAHLNLKDLLRIDPDLRGGLTANAVITSKSGALAATLDLAGHSVTLRGKPVEQLAVRMRAAGTLDDIKGDAKLHSRIDGRGATGSFGFSHAIKAGTSLKDIALDYAGNKLNGWLQFGTGKGLDGDLVLDAPTLKAFSTLAGTSIAGRMSARLKPIGAASQHRLKLSAKLANLAVDRNTVSSATIDAEISNVLATPYGFGKARLSGARISGRTISNLTLAIDAKGGAPAAFGIEGRGSQETLSAGGTIAVNQNGATIKLQRARLFASSIIARLAEPSTIRFVSRNQSGTKPGGKSEFVSLDRLRLLVGPGRVASQNSTQNSTQNPGQITVSGTIDKALQLNAELARLPMSFLDIVNPDIGAGGELNGRVSVTGSPSEPVASYNLALAGGTIAATRDLSISPVSMTASGGLRNNIISVKANASGSDGLALDATGTVSLKSASALNLRTSGQLPLKLLNRLLAERGTRGSGFLKGNIAITGTAANPQFDGVAAIVGGGIHDPDSGVRLANLQMQAKVSKTQFSIDRIEASAVPSGRLTGSGRITFAMREGFPVSAQLKAEGFRIRDRQTLRGKFDGLLSISGALYRGLVVDGNVSLGRFDIDIPDSLPRTVREVDVTHVNISKERRAELGIEEKSTRETATTPIRLNLDIKSDGRIFVRGRGLDAQLGGGLKLLGTAIHPRAEGAFNMIRGRMAVVGRRLIFNRGTIGFTGSLDPTLDFEANTDADGTVITTSVRGRASNPKVSFSSSPDLPEDELLARLLFNKSLAKLSPLQIAQLASEVDRLGGLSGGPGVLDQLRKSVGVDVLDVATDKKGKTAVTAGKYVGTNTYVGVQQSTNTNASRVIVDIDITKNIKAHGETGTDGNSKVGVGIEWNY